MNIPAVTNYFTTLMLVIGILVVLTNIVTEVLKKVLWDRLPTNILAVIVAVVLTLVAFFAYTSYMALPILWYNIAAAVVVAFMVAYAAMFGFDKLKEALNKINEMSNTKI